MNIPLQPSANGGAIYNADPVGNAAVSNPRVAGVDNMELDGKIVAGFAVTEVNDEAEVGMERVTEEMEKALRRDDDLGKLVSRAYDFAPPAMPDFPQSE